MASSEEHPKHHFDIHASVVLQLGESLISDVAQALAELVKNAYDADANSAKVIVNTETRPEGSYYKDAIGYITIEDDGIGMDEDTITRGWLTVSNSPKREMKRMGLTTKRGRTPLGDKGLGRLSAQRLAANVEIFTRPSGSPIEYHVAFSWNSFSQENISLTQVPVFFEELLPQRDAGTKIVLSDLKDVDAWKGKALTDLQSNLSQLISPYKEIRDFMVVAIINGIPLNLAEYSTSFKNAAILNYKFEFDEADLQIKGKAKLEFFRPANNLSPEEKQKYKLYIESDEGQQFLEFLLLQKKAEDLHIRASTENGWYVEYELVRSLSNLDKVKLVDGKRANPGQFHGEIDAFKLEGSRASITDPTLRGFIKELGGIRVFRDGFGIRTDSDILRLSKQQTSGSSWYGLRPENIAGYIAISAQHNAKLQEKTDREGFQANPYYDNFYLLLQVLSKFTADAQEFLRRGRNDFYKKKESDLKVPEEEKVEEIYQDINKGLSPAISHEETLKKTRESLDNASEEAQQIVKIASDFFPANTLQSQPVYTVTQSFTKRMEQAKKEVTQVENYLHDIPSLQEKVNLFSNQLTILKGQIAVLAEQISQTYETTSLGLTAEALAHEIATIAEQLAQRNRQVIDHLTKINNKDLILTSFTRYISAAVSSLRKQLSHLEPSLRYVRENREKIFLTEYFNEVEEYYRNRFETHNMEMRVKSVEGSDQFIILMNRGKLNQVIDNLLLNSEYWLREDLRLKLLARGIITVEISKPFIRISDNSRGIEPSVENSLFEPFVTTKGQGRGRGLGLFIVRQLLEADNCAISLLPDRNKHNRLYIFEISFTGGLSGSK
jgi:signal transduction histidine kinase